MRPGSGGGTREPLRRWPAMPRKTDKPAAVPPGSRPSGLVAGGRGGPEHELLESGQEEVFSRAEVESGRIEHQAGAGGSDGRKRSG